MSITRRALAGAAAWPLLSALPVGLRAAPTRGSTLKLVMATESANLIPIDNTFGTTGIIGPKVNEGLLTCDLAFKPVPQRATAWDIAADGLSVTFNLRQGVKWHDGKSFTAADVAFSILTLKRVHPRGRATFANVDRLDTPDDHIAIIRLSKPAPYLLSAFAASESPIVAKHIYDDGKDIGANPANAAPIGTGPFVFKEWVRGSHVVLERNLAYWDSPRLPSRRFLAVVARRAPGALSGCMRFHFSKGREGCAVRMYRHFSRAIALALRPSVAGPDIARG